MVQILREATSEYSYFISEIMTRITQRMGKDYTARIYKVTKNNSLELDSLVLLKEGKNFAPNIYLQPYFEAYQQGTSINELVNRLCNIYQSCIVPIVDEKFNYAYEEMKPHIIYRLVSYERNQKLLEKVPHIRYMDLAITYHCLVRDDEEGIGTIRITNEHMKVWKAQLKDIHEFAANNTQKQFPSTIRSMEEVIKGILIDELKTDDADLPEEYLDQIVNSSNQGKQKNMYILTNYKGINGASCLLYQNVLNDFAEELETDFYIFPSSIHEVILVPASNQQVSKEYTTMVREINETQVARDEVLSDKVYYYSRKKGLMVLD